jgi:peroxiredoxin
MLDTGDLAPEFQLPDVNGVLRSLQSFTRAGRALFVFYKASCPVCQLTLPFLDRLAHGSPLPVIFISQDNVKTASRFDQEFGISGATTLFDGNGYPVSSSFGITSVPSMFLIESGGKIARAWSGFSRADMEAIGEQTGIAIFTPDEMNRVPLYKPG